MWRCSSRGPPIAVAFQIHRSSRYCAKWIQVEVLLSCEVGAAVVDAPEGGAAGVMEVTTAGWGEVCGSPILLAAATHQLHTLASHTHLWEGEKKHIHGSVQEVLEEEKKLIKWTAFLFFFFPSFQTSLFDEVVCLLEIRTVCPKHCVRVTWQIYSSF